MVTMLPEILLSNESGESLYRQLYGKLRDAILNQQLTRGEKLPPTRELASALGLNRTTVAAAYELLEAEGLIKGRVGRGSFVQGTGALDWHSMIPAAEESWPPSVPAASISFAASRPSENLFPLDEFRATCREVIDSPAAAEILQLGPAGGYGPLRKHLLDEARKQGTAGPDDDILITSGCQQAFDLIQRVLAARGETVLLEDPIYPGVRNVFSRGGARVIGIPVGENGADVEAFESAVDKERPRLVVLTPSFQNPTGTTIPEAARQALLASARRAGVVVVENELYGDLRYRGTPVPSMKKLDESGDTILLSSFSKIAFPGLRVGWAIGPRHFIARLTEAKQACDLHSDQLSQAVLLRFAESGRLAAHHGRMLKAGMERLGACLEACARNLPRGSRFTRPEGGMNVWVKLPDPLDAFEMAARAAREGVSFLAGKYFTVSKPHTRELRLSFAGLDPADIRSGIGILGRIFKAELERASSMRRDEHAAMLV
jgi:DNA-binding transcriptional MocR family regulator